MFQLFGKFRDMALAVKNPCHLNMAACLIKLTRYEEAIAQCSIVCMNAEFTNDLLMRFAYLVSLGFSLRDVIPPNIVVFS